MAFIKGLFNTKGRIDRRKFIISFINVLIFLVPTKMIADGTDSTLVLFLCALFAVLVLLSWMTFVIRRFHDLDISGWASVSILIPYVDFLVLLYLMIKVGSGDDNKYGPAPVKNND